MTADPLDRIIEACWTAVRFGERPSAELTGLLYQVDGFYLLSGGRYHPLEAFLSGLPVCRGDWRVDAAALLGVDAGWIQGFVDGFARTRETSVDQEYVQGYLAGESLRASRYAKELP